MISVLAVVWLCFVWLCCGFIAYGLAYNDMRVTNPKLPENYLAVYAVLMIIASLGPVGIVAILITHVIVLKNEKIQLRWPIEGD